MYICDMEASINKQIESKVKRSKAGQIFLPSDFKDLGTSTAIRKTLSRLVEQKVLVRMGQGIYVVPIHDKVFGEVLPSVEEIAAAIAKKERVKIMPTGQYALNKMGLSTQVPMKIIFLTNGTKKNITIGKSSIVFQPTTTKKLAMVGTISSLLFLGLEGLDLIQLTNSEIEKIISLLKKEDAKKLKHDMKLTPSRISDFVIKNFLKQAI
jgi:predicted transcriptional regulator of viral defense system